MIKANIEECIRLTDTVLTEYFLGNSKPLVKQLHENCLWIGFNASEYYYGKETVRSMILQGQKEMPPITLSTKSFECVMNERSVCGIVGRYIGTVDENDEIFRDMQRVTFLWREEKGKLLICHMHISNPWTLVEENESFPHQLSTYTKEYINLLKEEAIERAGSIRVKDEKNIFRKMPLFSIVYMEGFDTNTIIHTVDEDILVKGLLQDIERQIALLEHHTFVRVHRSYMVNKLYVNAIKRYELEVANKYIVPISRDKYSDIRQMLFLNGDEGSHE